LEILRIGPSTEGTEGEKTAQAVECVWQWFLFRPGVEAGEPAVDVGAVGGVVGAKFVAEGGFFVEVDEEVDGEDDDDG